uniref:Uncharacterized protein n=1 Tax=Timema poppense TaxID=170557 RepID=A0A7R9DWC6_TIMPO|nr:unnamed protein product [Timema poppensis]
METTVWRPASALMITSCVIQQTVVFVDMGSQFQPCQESNLGLKAHKTDTLLTEIRCRI